VGNLSDFLDTTIKAGMSSVLPAGQYYAQAVSGELCPPKKQPDGLMIKWIFEVLHGEHIRRRITDYMVVKHSSADAVRMGKTRLTTFAMAAIGHAADDTSELLFRPVALTIAVRSDPAYGDRNEITDYKPIPPGTKLDARSAVVPGLPEEYEGPASVSHPVDVLDDAAVVGITPHAGENAGEATKPNALDALREAIRHSAKRNSQQVGHPGATDQANSEVVKDPTPAT
jgi:hypothetical protein